ncbi:HTH-type transcriptional repressor PurR [bioreactor metagenome]|uniref:HTH-type transcriptional repressor PurR n=1 Tax=bioreactor metagenome TaxID=1076179 RepID=A0A645A713_9ZZZZ
MHNRTREALERLETMIKFGQVGADGVLPSERDLAELLRIGRGAVRSVLRVLGEAGRVRAAANGRMLLGGAEAKSVGGFHRFLTVAPVPCTSHEALRILSFMADAANACGAEMVLYSAGDPADLRERCLGNRYAGVIYFEQYDPAGAAVLAASGLPQMVANLEMYGELPGVGVDYRQIGRLAGRTLVEAGHRNIGYIGGRADAYVTLEMTAGLKGALAEDDLAPHYEAFLEIDRGEPGNYDRIAALLAQPERPTAFMLGRDHLGQYFYQACRELKLRVPEDVSVIGYDNISWPDAGEFGLTTIEQPVAAIGREAVALLRRLAAGDESCRQVRLPGQLIRRASVMPLAAK